MTRRIGHGDPKRGTARIVLGLLGALLVVFLIMTSMPTVFAAPKAAATGSPVASNTANNSPASPTPQPTATGSAVQLLNPSAYGSPALLMSDKQDADNTYHFVAWVANPPSDPGVTFTMVPSNGQTPPPVCTGTQAGDTFACNAPLPADGNYTVVATLFSGGSAVGSDSQAATVSHAANSVEITSPTNDSQLGYYDPPGAAPPGFVIDVAASAGTENIFVDYTTSPVGTEPQWSRCSQQATVSYSDNTWRIGCALANNANPANVTAVAAFATVSDKTPGPMNTCLPTPPPRTTCGGRDESGDAHRVIPYDQAASNPTVTLAPQNPTVFRNSDNSQCLVMMSTVSDSNGRPIWRGNVDVHITGPTDTAQFASVTGQTYPFQPPNSNHTATESTYSCNNKNQTTPNEATHFASGADTKHIETTQNGSDVSGVFAFGLHSPDAGQTSLVSWLDNDDDDQLGTEPSGLDFVQWEASASPTGSASASATATASATASATGSPTASATTSSSPSSSSPPASSTSTTSTSPTPTQRIETVVTISYDPNAGHAPGSGAFKGRVKSAVRGCRSRTIKLFRFGKLKKTGFSTSTGRWEIAYANAHGRFYAKAIRKTFFQNGTKIVCRSDKSPPIRIKR